MSMGWRRGFCWAIGLTGVCALALQAVSRSELPAADMPAALSCSVESPSAYQVVGHLSLGQTQASPMRAYAGFRTCLQCHNSGITGQVDLPGGVKLDLMKEQWILYREFSIWSKDDKHGQAYTVLHNPRSQAMGKRLGVAEIHRDPRCLACHTGFPLAQIPLEKDGLAERGYAKNLDVNLGVSCEGCHGPSGDQRSDNRVVAKGWLDAHQIQPALPYDKTKPWRFLAPKEKSVAHGFYDVRSPAERAKLCASCHVGDVERGRMVTHEMFAAGHPPLPGFEMETFADQMPRHWVEFSAKAPQVQDLFLRFTADPLYQKQIYQKKDLHRTRAMLAGALATSAQYLRNAGQLAEKAVKSPMTHPEWPELAVFDCYACHHDLKRSGWRAQRKPRLGAPGRPTLQEWPFVLARFALMANGTTAAEIDAQLADVRTALTGQPFGEASEIAKATPRAAAWFLEKSLELEQKPVTQKDGIGLLKRLAITGADEVHDYDSARQILWAFQIVSRDLQGDYPHAKLITANLDSLGKDLFFLNLRHGRKSLTAIPGEKEERVTIETDLQAILPRIANYDPAPFRACFKSISALLQ
jgi:hypothetical protein